MKLCTSVDRMAQIHAFRSSIVVQLCDAVRVISLDICCCCAVCLVGNASLEATLQRTPKPRLRMDESQSPASD